MMHRVSSETVGRAVATVAAVMLAVMEERNGICQ